MNIIYLKRLNTSILHLRRTSFGKKYQNIYSCTVSTDDVFVILLLLLDRAGQISVCVMKIKHKFEFVIDCFHSKSHSLLLIYNYSISKSNESYES